MLAIHKPQRDTPPNGIPRFLKARCDALLPDAIAFDGSKLASGSGEKDGRSAAAPLQNAEPGLEALPQELYARPRYPGRRGLDRRGARPSVIEPFRNLPRRLHHVPQDLRTGYGVAFQNQAP